MKDSIPIWLLAPRFVAVGCELDLASAPCLIRALEWAAGRQRRLVVDLHDLALIDAAGLASR